MRRRFVPSPLTLESRLTPSSTVTTIVPPLVMPPAPVPIQAPLPPPVFPAPLPPLAPLAPLPPDPVYVPSWGERIQAVLDSLYADPDSWRIGTGG